MNKSFIKIYLLSIFSLMALVSISCSNKTTEPAASKGLEHFAGTWTATIEGQNIGDATIGTDGSIDFAQSGKLTKDKIKDNGGDEYEFSMETGQQGMTQTVKFKFTSDTEGTVTMIVTQNGNSQEVKGTLKKK